MLISSKQNEMMSSKIIAKIKPFIKQMEAENFPEGKYELGNADYAIITQADLSNTETEIELHQKYIDVHYVISGQELMKCCGGQELEQVLPYAEISDTKIVKGELENEFVLHPGDMVIFYPGEAHMPKLLPNNHNKESTVKKMIFKLEYDVLND